MTRVTVQSAVGAVSIGSASIDGAVVRVCLDALPAAGAVLTIELHALAVGQALLNAIEAAQPYYGPGPDSAVRIYRDADGRWCAGRSDDANIRADGCPDVVTALRALRAELDAESARRCPHCGLADDHDNDCPDFVAGEDEAT